MTEKKEHWKVKEKREREEAEAQNTGEVSTPEIVELEKKVAKLEKAQSRPYHIYDCRANIVAYADNEEEAEKVLVNYVGGWKKMI